MICGAKWGILSQIRYSTPFSLKSGCNSISLENHYYREYLYAGKEFEDDGSGSCSNPSDWDSDKRKSALGYDSDAQRYYMIGAGNASNYACQRFATSAITEGTNDAYECCKRRS